MIRNSVTKPFTVLVAVIIVIALGIVGVMNMTLDLLPEISLPYMLVITTYAGASPEKVDLSVSQPMEGALGTINGVKNTTSSSYENFSLIQLEFENDTDMNAALVKVSSAINNVIPMLPEECGTPSIMEISADMVATAYLGVSYDGKDIYELSDFVDEDLIPYLERRDGVAQVSGIGLVEKTIHIELNKSKVDRLNNKIVAKANRAFADALEDLDEAKAKLIDNQKKLDDSKKEIVDSWEDYYDGLDALDDARDELEDAIDQLEAMTDNLELIKDVGSTVNSLELRAGVLGRPLLVAGGAATAAQLKELDAGLEQIIEAYDGLRQGAGLKSSKLKPSTITLEDLETMERDWGSLWASASSYSRTTLDTLNMQLAQLDSSEEQVKAGKKQLESAEDQLVEGQKQIDEAWDSYNDGVKQFEKQRAQALLSANADQLLSLSTLSQLIYAQNFDMPAGYIEDSEGTSWLLKIGESFDDVEVLKDTVLCHIDEIGNVKIGDVADIVVLDNSGESYARMNGKEGILVSVFKSSSASTNEVSKDVRQAGIELEEKYPGLKVTDLMDQGEYIEYVTKSLLESMILGTILAVIVLAVFLKDIKPTIVVAISIPLSVCLAIVCMYFSGISLNIMTLGGLALGIGMLVDNSIVVIENIYRLRTLGVAPARAAVQGAKQVAGPIISSTLTTIVVFVPMLFTSGLVKDIILPMALTVTYCLVASLLIAMSVVPAAGSTLLKTSTVKEHKFFDKAMEVYGKVLGYCLKVKIVPLGIAIALLTVSVVDVLRSDLVMIPSMAADPIQVNVSMPEDIEREDAYKMADEVGEAILALDGIDTVGSMQSSEMLSMFTSGSTGNSENAYKSFIFYVMMDSESPTETEIYKLMNDIEEATKDFACTVSMSADNMDMSMLTGSGLSVNIYGKDQEVLRNIADDVIEIVKTVPGYKDITTGDEEAEDSIRLVIDKNKAMRYGLSVAQICGELSSRLTDEVRSTSLDIGTSSVDVVVADNTKPITVENLLNYKFKVSDVDADGDTVTVVKKLGDFATVVKEPGVKSINRENLTKYVTVSAAVEDGENAALLSRELNPLIEAYEAPDGYTIEIGGESESVYDMLTQMGKMLALGFLFVYLVMVAQFQSLKSPFIIIFTVPLAFTGGMMGLRLLGEPVSIMALMGFLILMGTVVNNGIVFVDFVNKMRLQGMDRTEALIYTGKVRMRPILMTALTTILALVKLVVAGDAGSQMVRGLAAVIMGGLAYATLMTLIIIPVVYDIFFKKQPLLIEVGDDIDDIPDETIMA